MKLNVMLGAALLVAGAHGLELQPIARAASASVQEPEAADQDLEQQAEAEAEAEQAADRAAARADGDEEEGVTATVVEIRGRRFRSPKEAGVGKLSADGGWVRWENDRRKKRSFAIQTRVVREASLVCATRAGSNVCLELELRTVTGNRYRFRDVGWSAGHAVEIRRVYEYLQSEHPRILFQERTVDRIR